MLKETTNKGRSLWAGLCRNQLFGKILIPASGWLRDKSCREILPSSEEKRNRIPFTAIFKVGICHGKDIIKAAKTLSPRGPLPSAFPTPQIWSLCFCPFSDNNNFLFPTSVRIQGRRTALWPSHSQLCGGKGSKHGHCRKSHKPSCVERLQQSLPPGCGHCRAGCGTVGRCHSHLPLGC